MVSIISVEARRIALAALAAGAMILSPCGAARADDAAKPPVVQANAPAAAQGGLPGGGSQGVVSDPNYRLGAGDQIRVIVFGQPDLSGQFQVDGSGSVALPLVGNIPAGGISAGQLEKRIADKLSPDYLRDPRVSVEVMTYRPFYIVGEVKTPGNYPYTNGMTVINAVAMAGGFTYRARDDDFYITRASDPSKSNEEATQQTKVYPGDVVTVRERWF